MDDSSQHVSSSEDAVPQTGPIESGHLSDGCAHCEEYLAGWRRAQADYQNLQRQTEQERRDLTKYSNERLLMELLPAIDQFGLALMYIPSTEGLPEDQRKIWENWLQGIRAVRASWDLMASSIGLERVPTEGEFDPALHDAAGEEEVPEKKAGSIHRVLQEGWRLHGKVLRPARVILVK